MPWPFAAGRLPPAEVRRLAGPRTRLAKRINGYEETSRSEGEAALPPLRPDGMQPMQLSLVQRGRAISSPHAAHACCARGLSAPPRRSRALARPRRGAQACVR